MRLILAGLMMLVACGCAFNAQSKPEMVAKNLSVGKTTLISVAETVDSLCTEGTLSQKDCNLAAGMYIKAQAGHTLATDALIIAVAVDTEDTWSGFFNASEYFQGTLTDLMAFIGSFQKGSE